MYVPETIAAGWAAATVLLGARFDTIVIPGATTSGLEKDQYS